MSLKILTVSALAAAALTTLASLPARAQDDDMGDHMRHRMMRHEMHREMMRHEMRHEMRRDMHRHMMHRMMRREMMHND